MNTEQILLAALKGIKSHLPDSTYGLCDEVEYWLLDSDFSCLQGRAAMGLMKRLFTQWPEYSGDPVFPVPGVSGLRPSTAFVMKVGNFCMWDRDTEYGAARWRLYEFLVGRLEA